MELGGVVLVGARKRRGFEGDNYPDVRQGPSVFSLPVFSAANRIIPVLTERASCETQIMKRHIENHH